MTTINTVTKIVLICVIFAATMMSISASDGTIPTSKFTSAQYNSAAGEGEHIHSLFYGYDFHKIKMAPPDYDTLMKSYRNKVKILNDIVKVNMAGMSVSGDLPSGYAKQTIVPDIFIGPLAINQKYETETVSMITFYGNEITVDVSDYNRR